MVLLSLGIWMMNDCTFLDELLRNRLYMSTGYLTLVSSCIIIALSMFGCLGESHDNFFFYLSSSFSGFFILIHKIVSQFQRVTSKSSVFSSPTLSSSSSSS